MNIKKIINYIQEREFDCIVINNGDEQGCHYVDNLCEELERFITCDCDQQCGEGLEGEVSNHIEDCSCGECHREMGKISPWISVTKK
jgi:hypothetical protein